MASVLTLLAVVAAFVPFGILAILWWLSKRSERLSVSRSIRVGLAVAGVASSVALAALEWVEARPWWLLAGLGVLFWIGYGIAAARETRSGDDRADRGESPEASPSRTSE